MKFWQRYCSKMEINKEEGNTIQINKPELCLKLSKKGTAEIVLQRHPNLHKTYDCRSWSLQLCNFKTVQVLLHFSSFLPISTKLETNFNHGSCETYQFFMTTSTLRKKEIELDNLSFTHCVSSLHRQGAIRKQTQQHAARLLTLSGKAPAKIMLQK